jgi:hypothetical protein
MTHDQKAGLVSLLTFVMLVIWGVALVNVLIIALMAAYADLAYGGDLPNGKLTPGVANPRLTKAVICSSDFRTSKYRHVSAKSKRQVYSMYGMQATKPPCPCEVDHLIALEIGGSNDKRNLWPQSYQTKPWNAHVKDRLENRMHKEVCNGDISLTEAQQEMAADWINLYKQEFQTRKR